MNNNNASFLDAAFLNISDYLKGALFVTNFLCKDSPELSTKKREKIVNQLVTDIGKCTLLSNILFLSFRFSKGRQHPFKYVLSSFIDTIFGIGYSMLFFYINMK